MSPRSRLCVLTLLALLALTAVLAREAPVTHIVDIKWFVQTTHSTVIPCYLRQQDSKSATLQPRLAEVPPGAAKPKPAGSAAGPKLSEFCKGEFREERGMDYPAGWTGDASLSPALGAP